MALLVPPPAVAPETRVFPERSGWTRSVKLVYWGPGRSGKTTNLTWLHGQLRSELKGKLVTLDSPGERTIFFDCLPLELHPGTGARIQLRLYTVPGQPRFRLTRRLVLTGVDGLVFVWDSRPRRLRENIASLLEARSTVRELGLSWTRLPKVVQWNKQDLPERMAPERLAEILQLLDEAPGGIAAVALSGRGVLETLTAITQAALPTTPRPA